MTDATITALGKADVAELQEWARRVLDEANGWAERAEVSRGPRRELTIHLDTIASRARHIVSMTEVLQG